MKHGSRRKSSFARELRLHTLMHETGIGHSSSKYIIAKPFSVMLPTFIKAVMLIYDKKICSTDSNVNVVD